MKRLFSPSFSLLLGTLAVCLTVSVPSLGQESPSPLYGTEAFGFDSPWEFLMYMVPGGLTGAAAVHFVFVLLAADRIVPGWSGDQEVD